MDIIFSLLIITPLLIAYRSGNHIHFVFILILLLIVTLPSLFASMVGAPYIPTPIKGVKKMLEAAKLKPGDLIYDFGAGDGRLLFLAEEKYQAEAIGYELSLPIFLWTLGKKIIRKSHISLKWKDFRKAKLKENPKAVFCFLHPRTIKNLQTKIEKEITPGNNTKIISYAFPIEDWNPEKIFDLGREGIVYLYNY